MYSHPIIREAGERGDGVNMAEDVTVSEETLASSLTLFVNLSKVLLQNAKTEAEGRTGGWMDWSS